MTQPTLTGMEKVAVLLKSMPKDIVDKVLRHLDKRQAGLVNSAMAKVSEKKDLQQKLPTILDEAAAALAKSTPAVSTESKNDSKPAPAKAGNPSEAKKAGEASNTPVLEVRIDDKTQAPAKDAAATAWMNPEVDPLKALALVPSDLLALALDSENAKTASLLMNCMEIDAASQIYKRLSPAKRKEVSLRFVEQAVVAEGLLKRIAQGVLKKCAGLRDSATPTTVDPSLRDKRMAALLRSLERTERTELLKALEESDAEMTGRVKALLYQFEDVLRMENSSVQKLLSEVDVKSLACGLRGAPPEIESKILANLSKRAQESLKEEISLTGTVPPPKVRQARQVLVEAIQRLDERGELVLTEEG